MDLTPSTFGRPEDQPSHVPTIFSPIDLILVYAITSSTCLAVDVS